MIELSKINMAEMERERTEEEEEREGTNLKAHLES